MKALSLRQPRALGRADMPLTREQRNAIRCLQRLATRWPEGIELLVEGMGTVSVVRPPTTEEVAAFERSVPVNLRSMVPDTLPPDIVATIDIPCSIGETG